VEHTSGTFATDLAAGKWVLIGAVGAVVEVVTPWSLADLPYLNKTQSADVMTLDCPGHPPYRISRLDHDEWIVEAEDHKKGPFQPLNTDETSTVTASAATGTVTLTASKPIFTADRVGKYFYMEIGNYGTPWEVNRPVVANQICMAGGRYYLSSQAGNTGTNRPTHYSGSVSDGQIKWTFLHEGSGICLVNSVSSTGLTASATVVDRLPDGGVSTKIYSSANPVAVTDNLGGTEGYGALPIRLTFTYPHGFDTGDTLGVWFWFQEQYRKNLFFQYLVATSVSTTVIDFNSIGFFGNYNHVCSELSVEEMQSNGVDDTYKWAWQEWDETRGYPVATCYYQQRLVHAGTLSKPQTPWLSRSADILNFKHPNPLMLYDDDAMTQDLLVSSVNGQQANVIRHVVGAEKLVIFMASCIVAFGNGSGEPLTPGGNWTPDVQGAFGSSTLAPIAVGDDLVFVTDKGGTVRNLVLAPGTAKYTGQDLCVAASHLLEGHQIEEWCYQDVPNKTVWMVRDDGILLGLTYLKEQEVLAWHRHDTGYSYTLNGVACSDEFESCCVVSEANEDAVYFSVKRWKAVGTSAPTAIRCIERMQKWICDPLEDAFFVDSGLTYDGAPATVISGLSHLQGRTVSVLADGMVRAQVVVTSAGTITITSASVVQAGLPIQSDAETLAIATMGSETLVDKKKIIPSVSLKLLNSGPFQAGRNIADLRPAFSNTAPTGESADDLYTGLQEVSISTKWEEAGTVFIRQDDPLPTKILSITPKVQVGG
jgi:hypothetical protein